MEKSTKILIAVSALALTTAYLLGRKAAKKRGYAETSLGATIFGVPKIDGTGTASKSVEEKSNAHGPRSGGHRPGGGPRVQIRNIYGGAYAFPYTPLYGYDQCTYTDKNGLLVSAPCYNGWNRAW